MIRKENLGTLLSLWGIDVATSIISQSELSEWFSIPQRSIIFEEEGMIGMIRGKENFGDITIHNLCWGIDILSDHSIISQSELIQSNGCPPYPRGSHYL